eukprot:2484467-Pyramimonas_sp.AAC.1
MAVRQLAPAALHSEALPVQQGGGGGGKGNVRLAAEKLCCAAYGRQGGGRRPPAQMCRRPQCLRPPRHLARQLSVGQLAEVVQPCRRTLPLQPCRCRGRAGAYGGGEPKKRGGFALPTRV